MGDVQKVHELDDKPSQDDWKQRVQMMRILLTIGLCMLLIGCEPYKYPGGQQTQFQYDKSVERCMIAENGCLKHSLIMDRRAYTECFNITPQEAWIECNKKN